MRSGILDENKHLVTMVRRQPPPLLPPGGRGRAACVDTTSAGVAPPRPARGRPPRPAGADAWPDAWRSAGGRPLALAAATTAVYPPESAVVAFSTVVPTPCPWPPARAAGAEWRRRVPRRR